MAQQKKKTLSPEDKKLVDAAVEKILAAGPDEQPLAVFKSHSSGREGFAADLIGALGKTKRPEAARLLWSLTGALEDKGLKKAAKKALYTLEQAGLVPEAPAGTRPGARLVSAPAPRTPQGWLGPYLDSRLRAGLLAIPDRPTGWQLAFFTLTQDNGLDYFDFLPCKPGGLKKILAHFEESYETPYPTPAAHVRFVILEAATTAQQRGIKLTQDYQYFTVAASSLPLAPRPVILDMTPEPTPDAVPRPRMKELIEHPLLDAFFADPLADSFLARLKEARREESAVFLAAAQKERLWLDKRDRIIHDLFDAHHQAVYKRMLEETALLFHLRGEEPLARAALDAALDLNRPSSSPTPHPFIQSLAEEWIREFEPEEKPSENVRDRDQSAEGGSRLILPFDPDNLGEV
ncbi:MAG: hypothetical protein V1816_25205 [Pseudomonadota bacterium]